MSGGNLEPKLKGYSPRRLGEKDWKLTTGEKKVSAVAKWIEWEFQEGGADIYGFIIKDKDGELLWAESYKDGPYQILRKGDRLRIRPKMVFEETG
jgi:hypothetical protein